MVDETSGFYSSLPVISTFSAAVRPENHVPLPDRWVVGFTDVSGSTKAIERGHYKAVNMAGAGASFAVDIDNAEAASHALQAMVAYSEAEFKLELRAAMLPVSSIRAAGSEVLVARYEAAPDCVYAMFSGGGLSWFGGQAKAGNYLLECARGGALPDLSGLTCRWGLAPAQQGQILSVIIAPHGSDPRFAALVDDIIAFSSTLENSGNPVTMQVLEPGPAAQVTELEALAKTGAWRWSARIQSAILYGINYLAFHLRPKAAGRDMNVYMESLVTNADFRKFDDVLHSETFLARFTQWGSAQGMR